MTTAGAGATLHLVASPVVFFEVLGSDGDSLRAFYHELFDWKIDPMPPPMDYGMVAAGGEGGIEGGIGSAHGQGHATFYVQTDDPQAALDRSQQLGGTTIMPPTELPSGGVIALLADPEGHTVGLFKPAA